MSNKLNNLAQIAEIIAAAAIVISLLFVGLQIRESARIAKLQLTKDILFQSHDAGMAIISDPATRETFAQLRGLDWDDSQLNEFAYFVSRFRSFELIYNLRDENLIDDDVWNSYEVTFRAWIEAPRVWQLWQQNEGIFEPEFGSYIRSLRE